MSVSPVAAPVRPHPSVRLGDHTVDITTRTLVAGIVEFDLDGAGDGDGARARALCRADAHVGAGADLFDLAPCGADSATADVVGAIVEVLHARFGLPISVRTRRTDVLDAAFGAGAVIGHDVNGTADPAYFELVAAHGATLILGPSASTSRCAALAQARLGADQIVIDAGLDTAPSDAARSAVLRAIPSAAACGHPLSLGLPAPGNDNDDEAATIAWAVLYGARIVRVHDVARAQRVCRTLGAIFEETFA